MTVAKRFILFLALYLLIAFLFNQLQDVNFLRKLGQITSWQVIMIFILLGELFGYLAYNAANYVQIKQRNFSRNRFMVGGNIFSLSLFLLIGILNTVSHYKESAHKKKFGNVEYNRGVMNSWVNPDESYIKIAFSKLESQFPDSNVLELNSFSVHKTDTLAGNLNDTIYTVWFTYLLENKQQDTFFSKINVFRLTPTIELFNINTRDNPGFRKKQEESRKIQEETFRELRKAIRQLGDTIRKQSQIKDEPR
jgi:hypothetical protein